MTHKEAYATKAGNQKPGFFLYKFRALEVTAMSDVIVVALITGGLSLAGTLITSIYTHRKSTALVIYRIEQLEKKVEKHNNVIERTYGLERRCDVLEERIKNFEKESV